MFRRLVFLFSGLLFSFLIPFLAPCAQAPISAPSPLPPTATTAAVPSAAPTSPRATAFAKAQRLYRTGKLGEAENEYKALIEQDPQSALAYVGLVRVYLKQKRLSDASTAAAKALELAPPLSAVHVAMGEVYFRQAKMDEAEKEFLREIKRGTRDARAYLGMARLYAAFSFHKSAKQMIDRAYGRLVSQSLSRPCRPTWPAKRMTTPKCIQISSMSSQCFRTAKINPTVRAVCERRSVQRQ